MPVLSMHPDNDSAEEMIRDMAGPRDTRPAIDAAITSLVDAGLLLRGRDGIVSPTRAAVHMDEFPLAGARTRRPSLTGTHHRPGTAFTSERSHHRPWNPLGQARLLHASSGSSADKPIWTGSRHLSGAEVSCV